MKGTLNYGSHNPDPFNGTPPRYRVAGSKYGRTDQASFGDPPRGTELAGSMGAIEAPQRGQDDCGRLKLTQFGPPNRVARCAQALRRAPWMAGTPGHDYSFMPREKLFHYSEMRAIIVIGTKWAQAESACQERSFVARERSLARRVPSSQGGSGARNFFERNSPITS